MELLEYVRLKGALFGVSSTLLALSRWPRGCDRRGTGWPRDDAEEMVSRESVPCSEEVEGRGGCEGDDGARKPFRIVGVADAVAVERKRPFALGAEATRRIKRDMDRGDRSGRGDAGADGCGRGGERWGTLRFSDFVRTRSDVDAVKAARDMDSLDWVADELYEDRVEADNGAFIAGARLLTDPDTASFFVEPLTELLNLKTDFQDGDSTVGVGIIVGQHLLLIRVYA